VPGVDLRPPRGSSDPGGPVIVRDAVPDDAEVIARVHVESWRSAYVGLLPQMVLDGLSVSQRTRQWRHVLEPSSGDQVVAADRAGDVLGFAHVGPEAGAGPSTGRLATLYLRPDTWGTGVGRQVHDAGLERLAAAGYDRALLWVLSTNNRAAHFYERQGWRRDGQIRVQQFGGAVVIDHRWERSLRPG
jgi:ribosomal protein S18 acetylase RimI-like enzyme